MVKSLTRASVAETSRMLAVVCLLIFGITACDRAGEKTPQATQPATQTSQPPTKEAGPKAFKSEVYRAIDDKEVVTITSPTELEFRKGGTNYICDYTRQDDGIRLVLTILGSKQAVYLSKDATGLRDGASYLYDAEHYQQVMDQEKERRRRAMLSEQWLNLARKLGAREGIDAKQAAKQIVALLDSGVDPNTQDGAGRTLLLCLIGSMDEETETLVIELLLDHGADPNLHMHYDASVSYTSHDAKKAVGAAPLGQACRDGRLGEARLLLERHANVNGRNGNRRNRTPLMDAAAYSGPTNEDTDKSIAMIQLLLKNGANRKLVDDFGYDAIGILKDTNLSREAKDRRTAVLRDFATTQPQSGMLVVAATPLPAGQTVRDQIVAWVKENNGFGPEHAIVENVRKRVSQNKAGDVAVRVGSQLLKSRCGTELVVFGDRLFVIEYTDAQAALLGGDSSVSSKTYGVSTETMQDPPSVKLGTLTLAPKEPWNLKGRHPGQIGFTVKKSLAPDAHYALRLSCRMEGMKDGRTANILSRHYHHLADVPKIGETTVKFDFTEDENPLGKAQPVVMFLELCRVTKLGEVNRPDETVSDAYAIVVDATAPLREEASQNGTKGPVAALSADEWWQKAIATTAPQERAEYYRQAASLYQKAADAGDAKAMFILGYCYERGVGLTKDDVQAVKWYQKGADAGDAKAMENLGRCYELGRGVEKDSREATKWIQKAAALGSATAQYDLGCRYYLGQGIEADQREAAKWYRMAAEQGHAFSQNNLGDCYESARGVKQDLGEAAKWYRKAAEQGFAMAQDSLGGFYCEGKGVEQDKQEAVKWYRKAAEQNFANSQCKLGESYEKGEGVGQDRREAIKWYRMAAAQGNADAVKALRRLAAP